MTLFLIGLTGFFALHLFSALRSRALGRDVRLRWGEARYMGAYSVLALGFFALMLIGYGRAPAGTPLWTGPEMARTLSIPLNTIALILVAAAYLPVGQIRRRLHHPMMIGVLIWAVSHLWLGGDLAKVLLVGSFSVYALLFLIVAFRRDARVTKEPRLIGDGLAILIGCATAYAMIVAGHAALTGVSPL